MRDDPAKATSRTGFVLSVPTFRNVWQEVLVNVIQVDEPGVLIRGGRERSLHVLMPVLSLTKHLRP
ncbi:MAG: hypothetical protein M3365_11355 [Gemmatimonadota bacterium]|nr:hypothetical protein [Gemmatimonadota bacterium]